MRYFAAQVFKPNRDNQVNIFITDEDPRVSAINLDDKRVIKMVLESAQMLCTALHQHGASHLAQYKQTHVNHPSNVWCRQTRTNYGWLLMHFRALLDEFQYRRNKPHKCEQMYDDLVVGAQHIPAGGLTPYANCAARADMGISYKHIADITEAYKMYLTDRWALDTLKPKWTGRARPF